MRAIRKRYAPKPWIFGAPCGYPATNSEELDTISGTDKDALLREQGSTFMPKFDQAGLLSAVVTDSTSGAVLMVAFMDQEAIDATLATGKAHFHSRSRGKLWMKGESSGNVLIVEEILVDCDQDALVLKVQPKGPTCHTNARSCFYRTLSGGQLIRIKD